MKKLIGIFMVCVCLAGVGRTEDNLPPHVTVTGTATKEVVPNQMLWSVRVQTRGLKLDEVAKEHSQTVQKVLTFVKSSHVAETNLQTSAMQFGENWNYTRSAGRVREGFIASTFISFKLNDFDMYQKLWLGLADMPSVSVDMVGFETTKRAAYQNETREKAIRTAKEKASALAKAIGSEIGEPLLIEEDQAEPMPVRPMMFAARNAQAAGAESGEEVAPGTIEIKTSVRASFRLLTNQK